MTEQDVLDKEKKKQQERFRFCDLTHPVIQQLINLQLDTTDKTAERN